MVKNLNTTDQGINVRHGHQAGYLNQGNGAAALGYRAGYENQSASSVAVGSSAGSKNQSASSVAIGIGAGSMSQGFESVAIGSGSGINNQQQRSVAIGAGAGSQNQDTGSIAIGSFAGFLGQGTECVAIGYNAGHQNQADNSIILNATGNQLNASTSGACHIKPIRFSGSLSANTLAYVASTGEIIERDTLSFDNKSVNIGGTAVGFPRVNMDIVRITPNTLYPSTEVALEVGGIIENTVAGGSIILKTPDGTKRYQITIDNSGNLITTLLA